MAVRNELELGFKWRLSRWLHLCTIIAFGSKTTLATSLYECPRADWRVASFFGSPVPSADFKPDSNPLTSPYYRGPVQTKLLPTAVLLAVAIIILAIFCVWRLLQMCCCSCCCRSGAGQPITNAADLLKGHTTKWCQALVIILSFGMIAGCIYGLVKVGPQTVPDVLGVFNNLKAYVSGGFSIVDGFIDDVDSVGSVMDRVEWIRVNGLDATDILAHVAALENFMAGLVNPSTIKTELSAISTTAAAASFDAPLAAVEALTASSVPALLSHMQVIQSGEALVAVFKTQGQLVVSNIASLPAARAGFDPAGLQTSISGMGPLTGPSSLSTTVVSIFTEISDIGTIGNGLDLASLSTDIQSMLTSLEGVRTNAGLISSQLGATITDYLAARPHIEGLRAQLSYINASLVVLPQSAQDAAKMLDTIQLALDDLLGGPLRTLPQNFTALAQGIPLLESVLETIPANLTAIKGVLDSVYSDAAARAASSGAITALIGSTEAAAAACTGLCNSYNPASATDGEFSALKTTCAALTAPLTSLLQALDAMSQSVTPITSLQTVLLQLSSQQMGLSDMSASLNSIPSMTPYLGMLDPAIQAYNQLPADKSLVFASVTTTVQDVDSNLLKATTAVKNDVAKIAGEARGKISDIRSNTLGQVETYEADYVPRIRAYDKWRLIGQYCVLALGIALAVISIASICAACPFCVSFSTLWLLLLMSLYGLLACAFFAVAVIGNDGCQNAEAQLVSRVPDLFGGGADSAEKSAERVAVLPLPRRGAIADSCE
eukprot:jgi/Botrbrau1/4009/Bobra.0016s0019.1